MDKYPRDLGYTYTSGIVVSDSWGRFQDQVNWAGAKGTQEEGKMVITAISYTQLPEAEEGRCRKRRNPRRSERDQ